MVGTYYFIIKQIFVLYNARLRSLVKRKFTSTDLKNSSIRFRLSDETFENLLYLTHLRVFFK